MKAIKDIPTNRKDYYYACQAAYKKKYNSCTKERSNLEKELVEVYETVCSNKQFYLDNYKVNLDDYSEFKNNCYEDGKLFNIARRLFLNRKGNYALVIELYDLFTLAKLHKAIYNLDKQIHLAERILNLKYRDYNKIIKQFYYEVHKHMILNGDAYLLGNHIGYLCINRCKAATRYRLMDFEATTKRKKELIDNGQRPWNKEEADYCQRLGIKYDGIDYRVYKRSEYYYEIALLYSAVKGGYAIKFESSDYRATPLRGKTYDDLIKMCDGDVNKICSLDIDLKAKLTMCDKIDNTLYTKFIRNENQTKYNYTPFNR